MRSLILIIVSVLLVGSTAFGDDPTPPDPFDGDGDTCTPCVNSRLSEARSACDSCGLLNCLPTDGGAVCQQSVNETLARECMICRMDAYDAPDCPECPPVTCPGYSETIKRHIGEIFHNNS